MCSSEFLKGKKIQYTKCPAMETYNIVNLVGMFSSGKVQVHNHNKMLKKIKNKECYQCFLSLSTPLLSLFISLSTSIC